VVHEVGRRGPEGRTIQAADGAHHSLALDVGGVGIVGEAVEDHRRRGVLRMQAHHHRRAHHLDEVGVLEIGAVARVAGGVEGSVRRLPRPPPLVRGRLERAARDVDAGRVRRLALRGRGQAGAVGAKVAGLARHPGAGGLLGPRAVAVAALAIAAADPVAAVGVLLAEVAAQGRAGAVQRIGAGRSGLAAATTRRGTHGEQRTEPRRPAQPLLPPHPRPPPVGRPTRQPHRIGGDGAHAGQGRSPARGSRAGTGLSGTRHPNPGLVAAGF
jgi:hypothetical protein